MQNTNDIADQFKLGFLKVYEPWQLHIYIFIQGWLTVMQVKSLFCSAHGNHVGSVLCPSRN